MKKTFYCGKNAEKNKAKAEAKARTEENKKAEVKNSGTNKEDK